MHRDLLQYTSKDERYRGEYEALDNHVEAFGPEGKSLGVVFEAVTPFDTPAHMRALVAWTRKALDEGALHPLLVTAVFVVVFLAIHPFSGRQRAALARADNAALAARGLCLCALRLARKHHREDQGRRLPHTAPHAGHAAF